VPDDLPPEPRDDSGAADGPDAAGGTSAHDALGADPAAVRVLVDNHRAFLRFLERRLGDRATAEDVLQEAFVRTLPRLQGVPGPALVPWFYTVLRHAAVDRARRQGAETRALEAFARALDQEPPPADVHDAVCGCVRRLAATLKPEYAAAIRAVDLEDVPVKTYAQRAGLTASAAGVRLFRARQALRARVAASCGTCAEHGCVDCSCGQPRRASSA
jgi:RNA polymerase sigma factor (sigma-70 family)